MTALAKAAVAPVFQPSDAEARADILNSLDDTLFVEASAGTGKTSSLVGRIVNLVATGKTTLDRIAAITFTEAAAAELRDRIRQDLEKAAEDPSRSEEERDRSRKGVSDLDQAAISTLHAFAALILHERPLEARLPPSFETTDEIAAGIRFNEAWSEWLDNALAEDSPVAPLLAVALPLGISLPQLKDIARAFHENYVDLEQADFSPAGAPLADAHADVDRLSRVLIEGLEELANLCHKPDAGDRLYGYITAKLQEASRASAPGLEQVEAARLIKRVLPFRPGNVGSARNWSSAASPKEIRDSLKELESRIHAEALLPLLAALREFALDYAERRRAGGWAEFHDLLVWARELLRDDIEVRDHFRRRFSHLLIDEAQDTDPIQAEIAMYLAESVSEGVPKESRPASWEQVTPQRGKLFVVGDPKQSIYRFRRADVAQMQRMQQRMESAGGRRVGLVQNFRSQKAVVNWVNYLFEQWMSNDNADSGTDEYVQSEYEVMSPRWEGETGGKFRPRVWALGDEESPERIDSVRRQEASEIAALINRMVSQGWNTLDKEKTEESGTEIYRPVNYSDICILMPRRTGLQTLERGLESHDVPYRLESASLVFETQEVRDLLNCLRSIDDPADQVATVAALRSPAFGCSDADLLNHYESGGLFDYLQHHLHHPDSQTHPELVEGPVSEGLAVLRTFHEGRVWESVGTLIDRFLRERMLMEAAIGHPRIREQWRRYRFLVERAWQFAEAGGKSLRSFVTWVEDQIGENARVTEAPVPESDEEAVRVMTVHAAKGLEFPVVVLTGINATRQHRPGVALFARNQHKVEVRIGSGNSQFSTGGFNELSESEKLMLDAEHVRLMYVATTRARDHLILSLRRTEKDGKDTPAGHISALMADRPDLWEPVVLEPPATLSLSKDGAADAARDRDIQDSSSTTDHSLEARDRWLAERKTLLTALGRPSSASATSLGSGTQKPLLNSTQEPLLSPTQETTLNSTQEALLNSTQEPILSLSKDEKEEQESDEPWRRGRAGTQVGRAVHAVLQATDLASGHDIADRAQAQAVAEGVPDRATEIENHARTAIASDIVKRAVASGRLWREVPVAVPVGGGSLHGFIDLLFEENDGLVVVDYKTDSINASQASEAVNRYRLQGGAYAHAIQTLTGKPVKEVVFLYLQPNREETLQDLQQAMADARSAAEELL